MSAPERQSRRRFLDPIDRSSEILFGLIMVLSFTGSLSAAEAGREEVRGMLVAALSCNLAWGIVDAAMYLMSALSERGHSLRALRRVRAASDAAEAHRVIRDALPPLVAATLGAEEMERIRRGLVELPEPARRPWLGREDWLGALAVFLLVFLSTLPVAAPFLFIDAARPALRVSNGVAIVLLFLVGYALGRHVSNSPWRVGLGMVVLGIVLVGITIALGG